MRHRGRLVAFLVIATSVTLFGSAVSGHEPSKPQSRWEFTAVAPLSRSTPTARPAPTADLRAFRDRVETPPPPPTPKPRPTPDPTPVVVAKAQPKPKPKPQPKPKPTTTKASSGGSWNYDPEISWYGPDFYGNRTACGLKLTTTLIGVAHRSLPCGTKITFKWKGAVVVTPVVDRGPYVRGRMFDLTGGACKALNHCFTGPIYWRRGG